jgi:pimeloyl-ACP methyl ester carboxylesterase/predicted glycosyltransferase
MPDRAGWIERDGVKLYYEVFGSGERTIVFLPTWSIVHSRLWKAQIPYFARHFRVVTYDGPGNGRSGRPLEPARYEVDALVQDALAVMDATGTGQAGLVSLSAGAQLALQLAARHPERVAAAAFIAPSVPLAPTVPGRVAAFGAFNEPQPSYDGWSKFNRHYWLSNYPDFLRFFFAECFCEPHSTKQREDCVGWGLESTGEMLVATMDGAAMTHDDALELASAVRCPVLVIHGDSDAVCAYARGAKLAEATGGTLLTMAGSGHGPQGRDPVKVNLALRSFFDPEPKPRVWTRAQRRPKRALYISSPIGLGHAQRDVAIAHELRRLHPDLQIDWLAQHPVTTVLEANGERVHPASASLASESAHIEEECGEHDLQAFEALRRMDEVLLANFMVFHDLVAEEQYDLWIGDEAWELDHFLHENPEEKRAPYAWMTDFVGYLPMPAGGAREAFLTADYNAEMIEHVERYPSLRDRAIFVGNPDDIVPDSFGPGLPGIREWTERHYAFSGYVTGFEAAATADRERLRAGFGYGPHEKVCIVTVGGSGVGTHLLRRIMAAYPLAKRGIPELRMIVVAGPRIDVRALEPVDGVEVHSYVPRLYQHLAACDIAVVQGGLTTTMELTAHRRPFLYCPLRNHFEQNFHVRHRLERYAAGRCMDYHHSDSETIARAMMEELMRKVVSRPVESDGAAKAAAIIGALL